MEINAVLPVSQIVYSAQKIPLITASVSYRVVHVAAVLHQVEARQHVIVWVNIDHSRSQTDHVSAYLVLFITMK
jgi:hypothetical protein